MIIKCSTENLKRFENSFETFQLPNCCNFNDLKVVSVTNYVLLVMEMYATAS